MSSACVTFKPIFEDEAMKKLGKTDRFECSGCGRHLITRDYERYPDVNFCPSCGRKAKD